MLDDVSCMMGILPGCFNLEISEPVQGIRDYIVEQGVLESNSPNDLFVLGGLESSNSVLKNRQILFLAALKSLTEKHVKEDDLSDLLCLEDTRESAPRFNTRCIPRAKIISIEDFHRQIQLKKVDSIHKAS